MDRLNLLRMVEGVSPSIDGVQVLVSVLMFVMLYALFFVLFLYLLNEKIQHGPEPLEDEGSTMTLPDTFKDIFRRRARA